MKHGNGWMAAVTVLFLTGLAASAVADDSPVLLKEDIYTEAPYPSCHASTLAETPDGLVAAWFGGTAEKDPDVGIWVSRLTPTGWTESVEVANGVQFVEPDGTVVRHPTWNPVLFQMPQGPLLLFFKAGPSPSTWWGMLTRSDDHGQTWSPPVRLPEQIAGPVKNKPVLLKDGRLLCPTSSEDNNWRVHFEWTTDQGQTWTRVPAIHDGVAVSAIQPSILQHADGRLQAIGRTRNKQLFTTESRDGGSTWSEVELLALPNPNSGTDAVTLQDGRHLLIYNHTQKGRSPLNLAISEDGKQWSAVAVLESEPGEYSYPAIIQTADGKVHATYTWKRQRIRHVVVDPAKFQPRPIVDGRWPE